jgi:hypothetical protein
MGNTTSAVLDDIVQGSNCALFPRCLFSHHDDTEWLTGVVFCGRSRQG